MRAGVIVGVLLIVLGVVSLVYQGFSYTTHKKVVDLGPIQATTTQHKTVSLPPILGVIALVGGIVLVATAKRAR